MKQNSMNFTSAHSAEYSVKLYSFKCLKIAGYGKSYLSPTHIVLAGFRCILIATTALRIHSLSSKNIPARTVPPHSSPFLNSICDLFGYLGKVTEAHGYLNLLPKKICDMCTDRIFHGIMEGMIEKMSLKSIWMPAPANNFALRGLVRGRQFTPPPPRN